MGGRKSVIVACVVFAILVATTGCSGPSLEERDPEGFKACTVLAEGRSTTNDTKGMGSIFIAADHARASETNAIEESAEELVDDMWMVDSKKLVAACEAEGFDMPAVVKK